MRFAIRQSRLKKIKPDTDEWNRPTFEASITIQNVIVQPQTIYSGNNNDRQIIANAVIYFFAGISTPDCVFTKDSMGSLITFEDSEYVIKTIVDNRDPFSNELYSYELEVL